MKSKCVLQEFYSNAVVSTVRGSNYGCTENLLYTSLNEIWASHIQADEQHIKCSILYIVYMIYYISCMTTLLKEKIKEKKHMNKI